MTEAESDERLAWQFTLLRSIEDHALECIPSHLAPAGSELGGDDDLMRPWQTSHLISHCLGVAQDAFRTVRFVLDKEAPLRIPMIGLYPLLRTALEASALALWIIDPDDQPTRLLRSVGVRWSDILYDDTAVTVSETAEPTDTKADASSKSKVLRENARYVREKKRKLKDHAQRVGVEIREASGRPGFTLILKDVAPRVGIPQGQLRGTWHFVSGLTHPSVSRSLALSDIRRLSESTDGVFTARVTANSQTLAMAIDAALLVYRTALEVAAIRSGIDGLRWPRPGQYLVPPNARRVRSDHGRTVPTSSSDNAEGSELPS